MGPRKAVVLALVVALVLVLGVWFAAMGTAFDGGMPATIDARATATVAACRTAPAALGFSC